jgi:hypothetical protein
MKKLFDEIPLVASRSELCPTKPNDKGVKLVLEVAPTVSPLVAAGLLLYVDDLRRSHEISQSINDATGAYWHAIMHRREGDFWTSGYWLRKCEGHPAMSWYDPIDFLDRVEKEFKSNPKELVEMQRTEWKTLFEWCINKEAK